MMGRDKHRQEEAPATDTRRVEIYVDAPLVADPVTEAMLLIQVVMNRLGPSDQALVCKWLGAKDEARRLMETQEQAFHTAAQQAGLGPSALQGQLGAQSNPLGPCL